MSTSAQLDGIFKREYDTGSQVLEEQQNLMAPSFKRFSVSTIKPTPQGIFMPVTMSGNEAGGAQNETQGFQVPGSLNPIQPQIQAKLVTWPFEITGTAIELSETNKQAFVTAIDAQQKDNLGRINSDLNRQSLGKGTGQMSLTTNAATSVTIPVLNPLPFRRGMTIDSYVSIGGAKEINGAIITAVDYIAKTLTVSVQQTWSLNSIIVKLDILNGAPVGGKELSGLQAICDTTAFSLTFEGVTVATNPEWVGNVIDGAVSPISQDLLQRALIRGMAIGGTKPDYMISNYGQQRTFLNTELQKTRYEPEKVLAGHTVLKWNDLEWLVDKDYDINEVGMYDLDFVEKFQTRDIHLAQLTGNSFFQIVGFDKVGGYYRYQGNMGTWKRNAHIRLTNLLNAGDIG